MKKERSLNYVVPTFRKAKSGADTSGISVKGTLHWVEVTNAITAEIRLYDRLFTAEDVGAYEGDFKDLINKDSLAVNWYCLCRAGS